MKGRLVAAVIKQVSRERRCWRRGGFASGGDEVPKRAARPVSQRV